jgi:hypothetical protein
MAERTGLEFVCAGWGISKLLISPGAAVPLEPPKTPLLPPTGATNISASRREGLARNLSGNLGFVHSASP